MFGPSFADFKVEKSLGTGYVSMVLLATHMKSGIKCAVKVYNRRVAACSLLAGFARCPGASFWQPPALFHYGMGCSPRALHILLVRPLEFWREDSTSPYPLSFFVPDPLPPFHVHRTRLTELNLRQVYREIEIHGGLSHKNVVDMYVAFHDDQAFYLVLEFASKGVSGRSGDPQPTGEGGR